MKMIIAAIRPNMKDDVIHALHRLDSFPGAMMSHVEGVGLGLHHKAGDGLEDTGTPYPSYLRLDIACRDDDVDEIVEAVKESAHTGKHGDGGIFVIAAEDMVRIRTGQHGEEAL